MLGQYFAIYEKDGLEKLFGILPLRKSEIVIGRYLYALRIAVINGIISTILAYVISILTHSGMNSLESLNFLACGFLYFCLMITVTYPLYFKFSFSKIYIFANVPFYVIFIIIPAVMRKTNALKQTGLATRYLTSNPVIAAFGLCLGFLLLAFSCLLSCALVEGNRAAGLQAEEPGKRLYFADNLRTGMVILVVLQHIALLYNTLYLFMMLNSAYFMGLLFLLSGNFTPGSFERKGPGTFLKDRLLRLGIPTLVYVFLLNPLTAWVQSIRKSSSPGNNLFDLGPMWFAVMLLVFDLGYLGWRAMMKNRPPRPEAEKKASSLTFPAAGAFLLALAAVTCLLRIAVPYGLPALDFPSPGYLPQYLSFSLIGIFASRRDWLQTVSGWLGKLGFVLAVLASVILLPAALFGLNSAFIGYGSWQSAVFALWDSIFAVGMGLALITFFRRFLNGGKKLGRFLSQHSFTVYIVHVPVIAFLVLALSGLQAQLLLKFCLTAAAGLPLCFG